LTSSSEKQKREILKWKVLKAIPTVFSHSLLFFALKKLVSFEFLDTSILHNRIEKRKSISPKSGVSIDVVVGLVLALLNVNPVLTESASHLSVNHT